MVKEQKLFGMSFTQILRFSTVLEGSEIMRFKAKVKVIVLLGKQHQILYLNMDQFRARITYSGPVREAVAVSRYRWCCVKWGKDMYLSHKHEMKLSDIA